MSRLIYGSVHEFDAPKSADFELFVSGSRFTDDTVLAVAVADCLLHGLDYVDALHAYGADVPFRGLRPRSSTSGCTEWRPGQAYGSFGNGSAMRVPAVGYAFDTLELVLAEAARSAAVTHSHPEGRQGRAGHGRRDLPRAPGRDEGQHQGLGGARMRLRPGREAGRHPAALRLRRDLSGHGAGRAGRIPRVDGLRGRRSQGDLAGRRRATRWPVSPAALPRRTMAACRRTSCSRPSSSWIPGSSASCARFVCATRLQAWSLEPGACSPPAPGSTISGAHDHRLSRALHDRAEGAAGVPRRADRRAEDPAAAAQQAAAARSPTTSSARASSRS